MNKLSKRLACIVAIASLTVSILPPSMAYAEEKEAYMIGNAHIDAAWNWRYEETIRQCIPDTFGGALELMKNEKDYHFSASSSQFYKWTDEYYPEMAKQIKEKVKSGQWDVVGGQICEPDLNVPNGEALVRQSLYAQKYFAKTFGEEKRPQVGFVPDVFGFTYNLPQILKKSGMDYFITTKLNWCDTTPWEPQVFKWKSPDGSEVLVDKPIMDYSYQYSSGEISGIVEQPSKMGLNTGIALYGRGDHGGGPNWSDVNNIKNASSVTAKMANAVDAFKALDKDIQSNPKNTVPTIDNELYLQKHRGVYTTAGPMKKYNRMSEIKAEEAEKFASIAYLFNNTAYPKEKITKAWERTALNQFHDVLPGSSISSVYSDAYNDAEIALNHLNTSMNYALDTLKARINTEGEGVPIVAFNALSWDRKNLVQTEVTFPSKISGVKIKNDKNEEIPCQLVKVEGNKVAVAFEAEVPAVGYSVYRAVPANSSKEDTGLVADKDALTMENNFLKVTINKTTGNISSIHDKINNKEVFENGKEGNVLQYLSDNPREYEAWDMDLGDMQREATDINGVESVALVENGPVKTTFRVTRKWSESKFVQDITLYADSNKVDIKNNIDWREEKKCLKVAFPMSVTPEKATYEIAYASIERPTSNEYRQKGMFEVSGHKWADMSKDGYGISILNDSKYGWDALDNRLRLTLLRAATDRRGGDSDIDHKHEFTYSIYPHKGDWKEANTVQKGYELNYPIIAQQESVHKGELENSKSFMSVDKENVVISVLKKAEDSDDMIVRVYESQGKEGTTATLTLPANIAEVKEVNLIEEEVAEPSSVTTNGNKLTTPINKYEIKTFSVKFNKPEEFKDERLKATPIDLSSAFNLDGMSYDSNKNDGNFDGNKENISADLMPDKVVTEDVEFSIGSKEDGKNNIVEAQGQTIKVQPQSHKSLYILGCSTDKSKNKGEFLINYSDGTSKVEELTFADWKDEVGNMLNTYIKDNIGLSLTHTHKSNENTYDKDNNLYVYKVGIVSSKEVESITLPKAEGIKIAAMSFVDGDLIAPTADFKAPSKVTIKAETPKKNNSPYVNLSWEAVESDKVKEYIIYRATKEDMSDAEVIATTSETSYKDAKMTVPTTYYYVVRARNAEGCLSASNMVSASGGNFISIGKSVESSSPTDCANVVDGKIETKWRAENSGEQWLIVDLKEPLPISKFVVKHHDMEGFATADFKIQVSNDKTTWSDVVEVKNNEKSVTEHEVSKVEGRYVRLLITKPCKEVESYSRAIIREFEIYGDETAPVTKVPEKASNITSIVQDENSVILNYEHVAKTDSYTVKYGTEPGKYDKEIKGVKGTSCKIDGLTKGKTYYFKVVPVNAIGAGPESEEKSIKLESKSLVEADLSSYFNLDVMGTENNDEEAANFDGGSWSNHYSYDGKLIPDTIKVDKVSFKMGSRQGRDKNVVRAEGQDITLPNVKATAVHFLGSAHNGEQSGNFVVNYEDGTKAEKEIKLTDWCAKASAGEKVALSMDHRIDAWGSTAGPAVKINMYSIALDALKKVKSITLPDNKSIKVFAITTETMGESTVEKSDNAKLSGITLDGKALEGFKADTLEYNFELAKDAEKAPVVAAVTEELKAQVAVTQAEGTTGSAIIVVTAEDGKAQKTYKVKFNKAENPGKPEEKSSNAKLSEIKIDGEVLKSFDADTFEYNYELPEDAVKAPVVAAKAVDSKAKVAVTQAGSTTGSAIVLVTAEDGKTEKTYKVKFNKAENPGKPEEKSNNAKLSEIKIDKEVLKNFDADTFEYNYELLEDEVRSPKVEAIAEDSKAKIKVIQAGSTTGSAIILVTAEDGKTHKTYKVKFSKNEKPEKPEENVMEVKNLSNITSFKAGKEAKVVFEAKNNSSKAQDATLIVALFDKKGNFVRYIATEQKILPKTAIRLKGMMSLLSNEEGYTIKCFVWDSLEGMNDLSNKIVIPVVK